MASTPPFGSCGRAVSTHRSSRCCTRSTSSRATRPSSSATRRPSPAATPSRGDWYDCSAHMLWVGERTRQLDGAHLEFLRGVHNPLGCKIGPSATADDVVGICEILNPDQIPGRLTLITRMGAGNVAEALPPLLEAVTATDHPVVWACDPMHGNTITLAHRSQDARLRPRRGRRDQRLLRRPPPNRHPPGRRPPRAHR